MSALHEDASSTLFHLDASTIAACVQEVEAAKARGWLKEDVKRYFKTRGVDVADYKAAKAGGTVTAEVRGVFAQVSITGLTDRPYMPNRDDIRRHLEWLVEPARGAYDDALIEIAHGDPASGVNAAKLFSLDEVEAAVLYAVEQNSRGRNVYVGAALRLPDAARDRRASDEDFYVATAVPIDIDEDYDATRTKMAAVCDDGLVVTTGLTPERRSQHWVRLMEPCDDAGPYAAAFASLVCHVGADQAVKDAARVMRLAGSVSYPNARKAAKGYCTELTTATCNPAARPASIDFLASLAPDAASADRRDFSDRPKGNAIEREGLMGAGRVINGREQHWRNELLLGIRRFQGEHGADPDPDDLWDWAWARFSDPVLVNNEDQRWTSAEGQKQLRVRLLNTLRRLRLGRLARLGLYSFETSNGQDEAEAAQAAYAQRRAKQGRAHKGETGPEEEQPTGGNPPPPGGGKPGQFDSVIDPWQRFIVPPFPLDTLPPLLRAYVEMQAKSTGADMGAVAMAALTACSGALDLQFKLKMKSTGNWRVMPRMWTLLVGDPSSKKTPVVTAAISALKAIESKAVNAHRLDATRWKADKKNKEIDEGEEPPPPTRYILNSITPEKLADILCYQNRGVLMMADELSGFIGAMDKYSGGKGGGADRAMWLSAYNGGSFTVDRMTRGSQFVENLAVSFLGGVQPDRLETMTDLTSDGLLQRFLPVMMGPSAYPQEVESDEPAEAFDALIQSLAALRPATLGVSDDAREHFESFQRQIFELERLEGLGAGFRSFLGKLTGVQGSLALLLHLISDPREALYDRVSGKATIAATKILRAFIMPHADALYLKTEGGSDIDPLRELASYVLTSGKSRFTASDFTSNVRKMRGLGSFEAASKVSTLVAGGWLEEVPGSVPVKAWTLRSGLREHFAEREQKERQSKADALRELNQLRTRAAA